jgi:hypothetical protein
VRRLDCPGRKDIGARAPPGAALLRGRHPREPRPGSPRPRQPAVPDAAHAPAAVRLPHARHHAGVQPSLRVDFKSSHVKQYFKDGWALRTETTFNDPTDVQPTKSLATLPHLREVGQAINARLLETERLSLATAAPAPLLLERLQRPIGRGPRRVPALRLGDGRVLAPLQALCQVAPRPDGFRHRDLRPVVAGLLGRDLAADSPGATTYDVRRLRVQGLIERRPHSCRYTVTTDGPHLGFGLSRLYARLLQPGWEALLTPSADLPPSLRQALVQPDAALDQLRPTPTTLPGAA